MGKSSISFQAIAFGPVWLAGRKTVIQQGKTAENFVQNFRTDGTNESLQKLES